MKNKILITTAVLLLAGTAVMAQKGHYLSIDGGAGVSYLKYDLKNGSRENGLGFSGKLGYSYFFDRNWGVGTGIGISTYTTEGRFEEAAFSFENQVYQGEIYRRDVYLRGWTEQQKTSLLEIPVTIDFQCRFGRERRHGFYADFGLKAQIPINSKYEVKNGEFETQGFFQNDESGDLLLYDAENHGFYKKEDFLPSGELKLKFGVAATAGLGFLFGLTERLDLRVGGTFDYGFMDIRPESNAKNDLVYLNENGEDTYRSLLLSNKAGKTAPVSFRGELGLRVHIGKSKNDYQDETTVMIPTAQDLAQRENVREMKEAARKLEEAARNLEKATQNLEEAGRRGEALELARQQKEVERLAEERDKAIARVIEADYPDKYNIASTELTKEQEQLLNAKIVLLREYPNVRVTLVGHTCDIDTESVNKEVGLERAQKVKEYLVRNGINASRISVESKGKTEYLTPNTNETARKKNRRVQFIVE